MPFKIESSGRTSNPNENFVHWSKLTLKSHFHISYQNSKISWQKMGTILVKSALNALKIEVFKKDFLFINEFNLVAHFLWLTFFENFNF